MARAVTLGQQLAGSDLTTVRVAADASVQTIPATDRSGVVGQTVAVSLPAGALLARAELGPALLPAGQAVVAIAVKPGQAPPDLAAGEHVALVAVSGDGTNNGGTAASTAEIPPWVGVVVAVSTGTDQQDSTVVSIRLPVDQAREVAAVPSGQINLVLLDGH